MSRFGWLGRWVTTCAAACWLLVVGPVLTSAQEAPAPPEAALTFEDDVAPILAARCEKCHAGGGAKGELDLRRRFTLLAGGQSGPAIVPGDVEASLLIEMLASGAMPPPEEGALDARQIDLLKRWIAAGAPTKAAEEPPLEAEDAESPVTAEDRSFWSFQPPQAVPVPAVSAQERVRNPIDAFLLARLEAQGLSFNPDAGKRTLIRRATFDLTGLPPTPEETAAFLADEAPEAYERLIDRLLSSPAYGERWGRHWLDVAGYADSDGYLEADRERPEAWRYRDYVIRAFNDDKPYDRFLAEQLAGDELADWRRAEELTPDLADNLIATGFLRTASDPTYPGYAEPIECHKVMADTIQIVSSAFLGLTMQCVRCHAHKFDPISQRDYYSLNAVFLASYDPVRWQVSSVRAVPLATEAEEQRIGAANAQIDARLGQLRAELLDIAGRSLGTLLDEKLGAAWLGREVDPAVREQVVAALRLPADQRNDEQKALLAMHAPGVDWTLDELKQRFPERAEQAARIEAVIAAEESLRKAIVQVRGLMDVDDNPSAAAILRRGDFNQRGKEVSPGVPAVLAPEGFRLAPQPGYKTTGRRRALAEWLTRVDHPLTVRVHVNRVWAHHFGRGIVETLDDFGSTGKSPTHPELLDWLAIEFIARGWSQKELHRLLMTSTAYRQTSAHDEAKAAIDPDNVLLWAWRPRRHEGEVVRDSVLAVAGKLNPAMFGPPVPVVPQEDGSIATTDDAEGNRRSVYLKVRRSQPVTMLETFDTPRMEINCTRRAEATVATQALAMLNSPFTESAAAALGDRIAASAGDRAGRIDYAYELLFARPPSASERAAVGRFLDECIALTPNDPAAEQSAWRHAALTLLNTNEFIFVD